MTKREAAIISAYTGYLVGGMDNMCKFIEEIMGRPVYTNELADGMVKETIKALSRPYFLEMCENLTEDAENDGENMPLPQPPKAITNYDRILTMSVEEMARFFATGTSPDFPNSPCYVCEYDEGLFCGNEDGCTEEHRANVYKKWLEKEMTEDK